MEIARIIGGSRLHGTATPDSDTDVKGVFAPDGRSILLQQAPDSVQEGHDATRSSTSDDVETDWFALHKFLRMLQRGHMDAVDALFAPRSHHVVPPHPVWDEIQRNRDRIITRDLSGFASYCRGHVDAYASSSRRLDAAAEARDIVRQAIEVHGERAHVSEIFDELAALATKHESVQTDTGWTIAREPSRAIVINGRTIPETHQLHMLHDTLDRLVEKYGRRVRKAHAHGGNEWKAMMHAIRVADEGLELLKTGCITLPRPDAGRLQSIRQGNEDWAILTHELEQKLEEMETLTVTVATLPSESDEAFIEDLILRVYGDQIAHFRQTLDQRVQDRAPAETSDNPVPAGP